MAEPVGMASGIVALTVFAFQSSKALYELFNGFQSHGSKIERLKTELKALTGVLESLCSIVESDPADMDPLKLPLLHCGKACQECGQMVKKCTTHSDGTRTSIRDWVKFNFMGKDISSFTTLLSGYKATIMIALGDANLRTSKVTVELLRQYKAMISSTTFDLEEILQDLDTAMRDPQYQDTAALGERTGSELMLAVEEERGSIQQCLKICMEVSHHIDQVQTKSLSPPRRPAIEPSIKSSNRIGYTTVQLRARLQDLDRQITTISSANASGAGAPYASVEEMKEVVDSVKQCLNICGEAAEQASAERVNAFEDVRAGDDGHQIILSTMGDLISAKRVTEEEDDAGKKGASDWHEIELVIEELSSTGDGLARSPAGHDHVFAIPFCLPGETVVARVRKWTKGRWSNGDLVRVVQTSPLREGVSPGCKYFAVCSGCQFQMLPYHEQLAHKKGIVERAFRNFSDLPAGAVPAVEETGGSPMQYGYRTKLTPHFDRPRRDSKAGFTAVPAIGFGQKGYRHVMDIENCPLVVKFTPSPSPRTPLLTLPAASRTSAVMSTPDGPQQKSYYASLPYHDVKTCISAPNALTTEYISTSSLRFDTRASSFFQNNNSILPGGPFKYLLDAYCGSGLLSLSLSPLFLSVLGIEIDSSSVAQATANARLNGISNCGFIEADAADLFADVPYPPAQTVLVIDPPRKGCSVEFLRQMLRWGPARVCYVSCNVHTLARDVGWMSRSRSPKRLAGAVEASSSPPSTHVWDATNTTKDEAKDEAHVEAQVKENAARAQQK
ncbi:hypothetical protein DV737_g4577, partial [Chaetothyriales sp. CBS 132003]